MGSFDAGMTDPCMATATGSGQAQYLLRLTSNNVLSFDVSHIPVIVVSCCCPFRKRVCLQPGHVGYIHRHRVCMNAHALHLDLCPFTPNTSLLVIRHNRYGRHSGHRCSSLAWLHTLHQYIISFVQCHGENSQVLRPTAPHVKRIRHSPCRKLLFYFVLGPKRAVNGHFGNVGHLDGARGRGCNSGFRIRYRRRRRRRRCGGERRRGPVEMLVGHQSGSD
jgi:hypothetical protein